MPKARPIVRTGFVQGIKPSLAPLVVPPNALWEARNVRTDVSGVLRIRRGTIAIGTPLGAGPVQGGLSAFGTVLFGHNRSLFRLDGSAYTLITNSTNTVGPTPTSPVAFARWALGGAEILYMFAGTGVRSTNGTTMTLVTPLIPGVGLPVNLIDPTASGTQNVNTGPARCTLCVLRAGLTHRIVASGDPLSPNTVYFSAPLDASYWPSDQTLQLPDDGGRITGLAYWFGALIIFRDRDVWAFFGADKLAPGASLTQQTPAAGCIAARTIVPVPGVGLVFLGNDNVYALQSVAGVEHQATATPLGNDIHRLLQTALARPAGVNAVYWDQEYRLCFPDSPQAERVFRLSWQRGPNWYSDTGPTTGAFIPHGTLLYSGAYAQGQLHQFAETLDDSGTPIPYYVAFRREALQPGPARLKKLFIYVLTGGLQRTRTLAWLSGMLNADVLNASFTETVTDLGGTEQDLSLTLLLDHERLQVERRSLHIVRSTSPDPLFTEPAQVYELRFLPGAKTQFAQLSIAANQGAQDIAVLGYGLEFAVSGAIKGRRDG